MPSWSVNGKWIYFCSNRGGAVRLWKASVAGGPPIRMSKRIAFTSTESVDGKTVYFTSLGAGLWQAPSGGGEELPVPELQSFHAGLYVAARRQGVYLVDQETSRNVLFFSFATRRVETIAVRISAYRADSSHSPASIRMAILSSHPTGALSQAP
jgi:hypothetical protein